MKKAMGNNFVITDVEASLIKGMLIEWIKYKLEKYKDVIPVDGRLSPEEELLFFYFLKDKINPNLAKDELAKYSFIQDFIGMSVSIPGKRSLKINEEKREYLDKKAEYGTASAKLYLGSKTTFEEYREFRREVYKGIAKEFFNVDL